MDKSPQTPASVLAGDTDVNCDLDTKESIDIHCRIRGVVTSGANIFVGQNAYCGAHLAADIVTIAGTVVTDFIIARSHVSLLHTACVTGDIYSPTISICNGAKINGRIVPIDPVVEEHSGTIRDLVSKVIR